MLKSEFLKLYSQGNRLSCCKCLYFKLNAIFPRVNPLIFSVLLEINSSLDIQVTHFLWHINFSWVKKSLILLQKKKKHFRKFHTEIFSSSGTSYQTESNITATFSTFWIQNNCINTIFLLKVFNVLNSLL